jgi:hypothetical protein
LAELKSIEWDLLIFIMPICLNNIDKIPKNTYKIMERLVNQVIAGGLFAMLHFSFSAVSQQSAILDYFVQ